MIKIIKICFLIFLIQQSQISLARDWVRYTTNHFTVYSDSRESSVIDLLEEFEIFRGVALKMLGLPSNNEFSSKLVIIKFDSNKDFKKNGVGPNVVGFYVNTPAGPRMVIGPSRNKSYSREVLFHEYTHFLVMESGNANYPRWFNEGLAEVLSSAIIKRNNVQIGDVPEFRKYTLEQEPILSINELISLRDHENNSDRFEERFYASSWLLAHYLQVNSIFENTELNEQTRDYLIRYNNGEDPIEAFETAFGMTTKEMDQKLSRYYNVGKIAGVKLNIPEESHSVTSTRISQNEALYRQAELLHFNERNAEALGVLGETTDEPAFQAEIKSLQALLLESTEKVKAASLAKEALTLGEENATAMTNLAQYEWNRIVGSLQRGMATTTELNKAKLLAEKAVALDSRLSQPFSILGDISVVQNKKNEAIKQYVAASNLVLSNSNYKLKIIKVLLSAKRADLARPFAINLLSSVHKPELHKQLQELVDQIASGDVDYEEIEKFSLSED